MDLKQILEQFGQRPETDQQPEPTESFLLDLAAPFNGAIAAPHLASTPDAPAQAEPEQEDATAVEESPASNRSARAAASASEASSRDGSEDGSSSSGEEIEDDDEDDDRPLSSRKPGGKSKRRTRRNILPRILRGQRCGHCHTCLNPQMKKACLTMRQKQMEELRKRGELPVSLMAQMATDGSLPKSATGSPAAAATSPTLAAATASPPAAKKPVDFSGLEADAPRKQPAKSSAAQADIFTREIQAIANRNGGVEPRYLPSLQRLYAKEAQLERRLVLMTVLKQSPPATLREAVRNQKVVLELQKWLAAAAEAKEFRLAFRVIETLDKLPIDLAALQSTGIGRSMAKLRKSGPDELKKSADALVAKWKKAVDSDSGDATKRSREPGEAAPAAAKKLRTGDGSAKADLPRQSSLESKAAVPMEVDDTAMFQRKAPATTAPEPLLQRKKVQQVRVLSEEAVKKLKSQEAEAGSPRVKAEEAKPGDAAPKDGDAASSSDDTKADPSKLGSKPPPSAFASAPLSMPLGASRLSGAGSGITRIGGIGSSSFGALALTLSESPLDAAARAAAAAARIPDPPEMPKKEKAKKVSWVSEDDLVLVRWFRQADPVVAVREDAKEETEPEAAANAAVQPQFQSAAKREHEAEAAAIRQHFLAPERAEEIEEVEAQLQAATRRVGGVWAPMTEWPTVYRGPPLAVDREREYGMPTEEERRTPGYLEVAAAVAAVPAVHYALPAMVPHTPQEAPHEAVTGPPPISIPCPRLDPPPVLVAPQQAQPAASLPVPLIAPHQAPPAGFQPQPGFQQPPNYQQPLPFGAGGPGPSQPGFGAQGRGPPLRGESGRGRGEPGRGRGGRQRGEDGGRGRGRGRGNDIPSKHSRRKPGEPPKPAYLVPCKWHFSSRGCRNGNDCRFSHNPEHFDGDR